MNDWVNEWMMELWNESRMDWIDGGIMEWLNEWTNDEMKELIDQITLID